MVEFRQNANIRNPTKPNIQILRTSKNLYFEFTKLEINE